MKIHPDDEAFLVSRMSDVSVALILNWSLARVERARAFIAERDPPPAVRDVEKVAEEFVSFTERTDPNLIGKAIPSAEAVDPADLIGAPAVEEQIDLEEAIAASRGPCGSPPGLSAAGLAAWLVDNTDADFDEIATIASIPLAHVQAIADDEPWPPEPKAKPPKAQKTAVQAPKPQKAPTVRATPSPPPTARNPGPATPKSEIPARVVRWAGFFIAARWQMTTVAGLFDCDPRDLAAALGR